LPLKKFCLLKNKEGQRIILFTRTV